MAADTAAPAPDVVAAPITRVAIDPSWLAHEPATEWCRHEVRRMVAVRLVVGAAACGAVAAAVTWWQLGDPTTTIAVAIAAAIAVTVLRWWIASVFSPLGARYVRRYTASPPDVLLERTILPETAAAAADAARTGGSPFAPPAAGTAVVGPVTDLWDLDPAGPPVPAPAAEVGRPDPIELVDLGPDRTRVPDPHPNCVAVEAAGFALAAVVRMEGPDGRVVDLLTDGERSVAAVDRTSGSVTVLSELVGFRMLVTTALLVPPTDDLVLNVVTGADPAASIASHRRLVAEVFRNHTLPSDPVGLYKLLVQREVEGYRGLGARWASVLDLRCRSGALRLLSAPTPEELLLYTGNQLFRQTSRRATPVREAVAVAAATT